MPVERGTAPPARQGGSAHESREQGLPQVGSVLGAYRVISRVGSGGMAVIYRAEHVRLRRQVALKVLRPALASRPASIRRFVEEARAVNEIGHPNIVDIIDIIEEYDRDPPLVYMVMELLEGEDLHSRLAREGALSVPDAVDIARQIGDALTATHAENILHRDLKPSNVFLSRNHGKTVVKLLDFGLLKHFGDRPARHLTRPEVVPGTPLYMSPEQIMGGVLDQRTDVYGFGLVVYEMLANTPPFSGKQDTEVLVLHAKEPAPSLGERCPDLHPDLVAAVMRCLEKDPDHRYPTVAAARDALVQGAHLPTRSSTSSLTSVLVPLQVSLAGRPRWLIPLLIVMVAALGVGGLWWRSKETPSTVPSRSVRPSSSRSAVPASGSPLGQRQGRAARGAPALVSSAPVPAPSAMDGPPAEAAVSTRPDAGQPAGRTGARAARSVRPQRLRSTRRGRKRVLPSRRHRRSASRSRSSADKPSRASELEAVTVDPWSH